MYMMCSDFTKYLRVDGPLMCAYSTHHRQAPLEEKPRQLNFCMIAVAAAAVVLGVGVVAAYLTRERNSDTVERHSAVSVEDREYGCRCVYVGNHKGAAAGRKKGGNICVCPDEHRKTKATGKPESSRKRDKDSLRETGRRRKA
ncbi:uncharacterized protein [Dermacentor andersoni]|uniref:uncharacterized protein n=1 Tax=Dermacentor andersoni TaxID=34620 RepID=UPI003B3B966C